MLNFIYLTVRELSENVCLVSFAHRPPRKVTNNVFVGSDWATANNSHPEMPSWATNRTAEKDQSSTQ